jgi:predicted dehydrogenase
MSKKIRIGVVGCGGIATVCHMPAYAKMDNVEIVALCDIIPEKAEKLAEKYGVKKTYTDYKEMIAKEELDAVDICTPNYLHSVIAVEAFKAGKNVFSEKPDSINVEEVLKMKKASEEAGKLLMVMRNNLFEPASQYAKEQIKNGVMGEIYAGRCGWIRRRGIPGKGGWFTTKAQSGGGPLIDLGVHMIDLAIYLMGNPTPVAVSGSIFNKFAEDTSKSDSVHSSFGEAKEDGTFDVEDLAMGFIKFDNGACLQIEFSWASNIAVEKNFVELRGTKQGLTWENCGLTVFGEEDGKLVDIKPELHGTCGGHEGNLRHFADVLLNGTEPCYKPQQGVDMIKILCAIYESAKTGREVTL